MKRKSAPTTSKANQEEMDQHAVGTPYVLIVAGEKDSSEQQKIRIDLVKASERYGLKILKTVRFSQHRVTYGSDSGRALPLVAPEDARWMYEVFHRYDVAVLALRAGYVRKDPSMNPARERNLITLERFVRYKAYHGSIRSSRDIDIHLKQFSALRGTIGCDGVDDPRALPLHIFNCDSDWPTLGNMEGRELFAREHGTSSRRRDCSGLRWEKPKGQAARHGGPALRVARRMLEQGFHWDVSGGPARRIYSPDAVWILKQERSYINIYPNGHLRAPGPRFGTVREWPR